MKKNDKFTIWNKSDITFKLFFSLLFLVCPIFVSAQTKSVSGTVTEYGTNEKLIGVSVGIEGETKGTITDIDGNFTLTNIKPSDNLTISYVGFTSQTVNVGNNTNLKIVLKPDTKDLDEVVVVGFATQKKVNLTGSVGIANAKELEGRPVMLATQALQGLVPGLNISQNSGSLESRASINIRGTGTIGEGSKGDPLILIDGMEADINTVNPQDIESISVLKDAASSSIYGARAPFGVVLITTKKGKSGKAKINYNNSFRWNKPINMPEMMDSYTFANFFNDAATNGGGTAYFGEAWMANILAYQQGKISTSTVQNRNNNRWEEGFDPNGINNTGGNDNRDYYKELYRDVAMSQEHNVSVNGGTDVINYYLSFNFLDQGGLMEFNQDKYQRYGATAKIGFKATEWLDINYNNRFNRSKFKRPSTLTDNLYSDIGRQGWPILPMYDPNGHMLSRLALGLRDEGSDFSESDNLYQQIQAVFEPIKNWKTFVEFNYSTKSDNRHWDKQITYMYDVNQNPFVWNRDSNVHEDTKKNNYMNLNLYTNYSLTLNDLHNFTGMVGLQTAQTKETKFGMQRNGILVPGIDEIDGTSGLDYDGNPVAPSLNGSRARWATLGYFGRVNYDYKGLYLLEANLRADGSSRFRSGNRWVTSPSFSAGWNIAQEDFWQSLQSTMGTFKLRVSYGQLANQNTSNWYPTYSAMGIKVSDGAWMFNDKRPNVAYSPLELVRENPTWEKIRTRNIGVDFGFFNNRLTGNFDYYVRQTKDMIGPAPTMPATLGVKVPKANNTDLEDKGFELQIAWRDQLKNGLGYGVKLSLSDYQTKIKKYPNPTNSIKDKSYIAGRHTGEIWGFETIGIAKTQEEMDAHLATTNQSQLGSQWQAGDIMYKGVADENGNLVVSKGSETLGDHGALKVIGNKTPRYQFGIELTADWKGFDFRAFFQGVMKRDYFQGSYYFWGAGDGGMWWSTGLKQHSDYFRNEASNSVAAGANDVNLNSYYPRPLFGNNKNQQAQTKYLQNAAYMRLKNLQIGYTLPPTLTEKFGISKLRVFASGDNLFTITSLKKMFDPETIDGGWKNSGSVYPVSTVYSFGLSINF